MNVLIIGAGYVGLSLALILAEKHSVKIFDIDSTKVDRSSQ